MNRDRKRPRQSGEPAHGLRADTQRDPATGAPTEQLDIEQERRLNLEVIKEVLADLADAGFQVDSLRDLRHSGQEYRRAVPILLDWLKRVERRGVKEEIVRTLSMPFAKEALPVLLREFEFGEDPTGVVQLKGTSREPDRSTAGFLGVKTWEQRENAWAQLDPS